MQIHEVVVSVTIVVVIVVEDDQNFVFCYSRSVASYTGLVSNDREVLQHYKRGLDS